MLGFIYIMSNPAHPGLLKIGQTSKDSLVRRKELSTIGILYLSKKEVFNNN